MAETMESGKAFVLEASDLDLLVQAVIARGYEVMGPTLRDRTIVYDRITSADDLPRGWTDEQEKGTYRLRKREDEAFFGYASTLHAWKKYLRPPRRKLWEVERTAKGMEFREPEQETAPMAFLGVRGCDLHAIAIQDRVFAGETHPDPHYLQRREGIFIVAVNCTAPAATCFCTAMGTGPRVTQAFDLVMTEVVDGDSHYFLLASGSDNGEAVLRQLPVQAAQPRHLEQEKAAVEATAAVIDHGPRTMESADLKELLYRNYDSPQWDEVAGRCLSCANCTMVCPTCFCSSVEDVTDVEGNHAERWERWDSCFTADFSYLHGGAVRQSTRSRYRQWMTHKLATWYDQFGTSGCVGCGRCITWCPVGIDITEEVTAIRVQEMNNG